MPATTTTTILTPGAALATGPAPAPTGAAELFAALLAGGAMPGSGRERAVAAAPDGLAPADDGKADMPDADADAALLLPLLDQQMLMQPQVVPVPVPAASEARPAAKASAVKIDMTVTCAAVAPPPLMVTKAETPLDERVPDADAPGPTAPAAPPAEPAPNPNERPPTAEAPEPVTPAAPPALPDPSPAPPKLGKAPVSRALTDRPAERIDPVSQPASINMAPAQPAPVTGVAAFVAPPARTQAKTAPGQVETAPAQAKTDPGPAKSALRQAETPAPTKAVRTRAETVPTASAMTAVARQPEATETPATSAAPGVGTQATPIRAEWMLAPVAKLSDAITTDRPAAPPQPVVQATTTAGASAAPVNTPPSPSAVTQVPGATPVAAPEGRAAAPDAQVAITTVESAEPVIPPLAAIITPEPAAAMPVQAPPVARQIVVPVADAAPPVAAAAQAPAVEIADDQPVRRAPLLRSRTTLQPSAAVTGSKAPEPEQADPISRVGEAIETLAAAPSTTSLPVQPSIAAARLDAPPAAPVQQNVTTAPGHKVLDLRKDGQWIDQLARDIASTSSAGADGTMRFRLAPGSLGELHVEITQSDQGAHVRLHASSEAAQQALSDAAPKLAAEARAQGVRIADTQVSFTSGGGAEAQQQQQDTARQRAQTAQHDVPFRALRNPTSTTPHASAPERRRSDRYA